MSKTLLTILCVALALIAGWFAFLFFQLRSVVDHTSLSVTNFEKSAEFYDKTLAPLGIKRLMTFDCDNQPGGKVAGYGVGMKPSFWIANVGNPDEVVGKSRGVHFAFTASSRKAVDEWYKVGLELDGKDNGQPGLRPEYHKDYYGAFLIDPDGWRLEACAHSPWA